MKSLLILFLIFFALPHLSDTLGCGLYIEDIIFDETVSYQSTSQYFRFLGDNSNCGYFMFEYLGINNANVTFNISGPSSYGPLFHTIPRICFYSTNTIREIEDQPPDAIIACKNSTNFAVTLPAQTVKSASIDYISFNQRDWKPLWKASIKNPSATQNPYPYPRPCNNHNFLISFLSFLLIGNVGGLFVVSALYFNSRKALSLLTDENTPIS